MSARWAVVRFPGSNCEQDLVRAVRDVLGHDCIEVWHKDPVPDDVDCIGIPGGFSYGDYLRAGSLAAMSPVMRTVKAHAEKGTLVIGICNGFQVLCEAGLLPGALMKNRGLRFRCMDVNLRVMISDSPFVRGKAKEGDILRVPIAHGFGNYYVPSDQAAEIKDQILFQYCSEEGEVNQESNPNGSLHNIAGITNKAGNVLGMMPHPERAVEYLINGSDGRKILEAMTTNAPAKA